MNHNAKINRGLPSPAHLWWRVGMVMWLTLGGLAGPVTAQLSDDDIAALRERGRAEGWTFTIGKNPTTEYPLHELCGLIEPEDWRLTGPFDPCSTTRSLPASFDWRDDPTGGCPPARSQGGCGSCWAFSAIGAMECAIMIDEGLSVDLSEQWLISCTAAGTCGGGWHSDACQYLRYNGSEDPCGDSGAVFEDDFPYEAWDAPCGCPYSHPYALYYWVFVGP